MAAIKMKKVEINIPESMEIEQGEAFIPLKIGVEQRFLLINDSGSIEIFATPDSIATTNSGRPLIVLFGVGMVIDNIKIPGGENGGADAGG